MYCVGARVLCMQGHPEFDAARLAEIAQRRREAGAIDERTHAAAAHEIATVHVDRERLRALLVAFLRR